MGNTPERNSSTKNVDTQSIRDEGELDRQPGSNQGTKGQMRESRRVARAEETRNQTMAGHDAHGRSDRSSK